MPLLHLPVETCEVVDASLGDKRVLAEPDTDLSEAQSGAVVA
jgi:hypothetical protein